MSHTSQGSAMTGKVLTFRLLNVSRLVSPQRSSSVCAVYNTHWTPNNMGLSMRLCHIRRPIAVQSVLGRCYHQDHGQSLNTRVPEYAISPPSVKSMSTGPEKLQSSTIRGNDTHVRPSESLVTKWLSSYEHFIGVKDVKDAQERVSMTEKEFLRTRQQVKESRQELENIQSELHSIRTRLDRTPRDDPKFLEYATEEHKMIQTEKQVNENHHRLLDEERETFDRLSASVRESHIKQKAQEEKTKYWSIIGSVVGTVLGIIGSTFISQRRTRDLKNMVNDLKEQISFLGGGAGEELKGILEELKKTSSSSSEEVKEKSLDSISQKIIDQTGNQLKSQEEVFNRLLQRHEKSFHDEIKGVHRAISVSGSGDIGTFEELIEHAEQKLEWEVKMGTLATVVLVYGAFAVTVPVLYNIFK